MNLRCGGVVHGAVGLPPDDGPIAPACMVHLAYVGALGDELELPDREPTEANVDCMTCISCLGIARVVRVVEGWKSRASVYQVSPPLEGNSFVTVSAVVAPYSGSETYIFPAHETDDIGTGLELDGSYRGGLSHSAALAHAGYRIVDGPSHEASS